MRRALTVLTVCAAAATFAACGDEGEGSSASAGGGSGTNASERTPQDAALDFARCMRSRGVDMPDPKVSEDGGMVQIRPGKGAGPERDGDDPKVRQAHEACQEHLQGIARDLTPQQREEMEDKMLALAKCMRAEGIDFPDPVPGKGLRIDRRMGEQPGFQAAQEKCHEQVGLQAPGGPAGDGEGAR